MYNYGQAGVGLIITPTNRAADEVNLHALTIIFSSASKLYEFVATDYLKKKKGATGRHPVELDAEMEDRVQNHPPKMLKVTILQLDTTYNYT